MITDFDIPKPWKSTLPPVKQAFEHMFDTKEHIKELEK